MRTLTLRAHALADLTDGELREVAAADVLPTLPPGGCVTAVTERVVAVTSRVIECASVLEPCVTSTC